MRKRATGSTTPATATYLNTGYLTWAGITAGKAQSFYSFIGGGDNWANFASPDRKGFNEPDLLAYTASFGGGFTATISAQSPGRNGVGQRHGSPAAVTDIDRAARLSIRRPEVAGLRRRLARQAGLGRGAGLGRDPQRQRRATTPTTALLQPGHRVCGAAASPSLRLQRSAQPDRLGHRRRREGQPAVVRRRRRRPHHRLLHPERGLVLGSAGHDVGRERPGQRQRPVDVSCRTRSSTR